MAEIESHAVLDAVTVAQLVLRYLAVEGVDRLFGIPGAAVMHLLDELKLQRADFSYVVCRHESGAAYIADGYARVSGKLGVLVVTSGPGATNAVTGAMNAQNGGSPLLVISGEVSEKYFGMGYLQEGIDASLNVDAIYANATRYSAVVTAATNFQTLFSQALRDALSVPRRAVHLSLPDDIAASSLSNVLMPKRPENYRATPRGSDPQAVRQAFELLVAAKRPLLFLGDGARIALAGPRLEALKSLVEKLALPVMTTPDAKGIFPESHALSLRNYGVAGCAWPKLYMNPQALDPSLPQGYDALLVIGSSLGELATSAWAPLLVPKGPFMQLDLNQAVIGRAFPLDLGIVADAGVAIDQLSALGEITQPDEEVVRTRRELVARIKNSVPPWADAAKRDEGASPIKPQALMKAIGELLPKDAHVFIDAGNCVGWSLNGLEIDPPARFHSALAMGPMGFGVAGVIGGKLAAPERTCVAIVGDGAFLMHGNEVSTAAQVGAGAIWIVLADNDLAMVSQGMNQFFPDSAGWKDFYKIGNPDVAKLAAALGADAYDARSPAEVRRAFEQALTASACGKPQVIVAHIDTNEIPPYYPPAPPPP
jgi:acetolactate synthase-1/2/3 large subunit